MDAAEDDRTLRPYWLRLRLLAAAILATDVVYLVVCLLIVRSVAAGEFKGFVEPSEEALFRLLRVGLLVISLPCVGAAFWTRGLLKRKRRASRALQVSNMRFPDTEAGRRLALLTQAMILSMSVATTPAIFGLTMFLIMGGLGWLGVFLAISFAAKLFLFPSEAEIDEMKEAERLLKM